MRDTIAEAKLKGFASLLVMICNIYLEKFIEKTFGVNVGTKQLVTLIILDLMIYANASSSHHFHK